MGTKTLGELLPAVINPAAQPQTVSPRQLTDELRKLDLEKLPQRLDDPTLASLKALATCPIPPLACCPDAKFHEAMATMQANLPRRASDEISGEIQSATYARMLGERPEAAIDHLVNQSIRTCKWFPTIGECLTILDGWQRADGWHRKREAIRGRVSSETSLRFDEAMSALHARSMPQGQIDALPEKWCRIAAERCYLWALRDGRYISRPDPAGMSDDELAAHRSRVAAMQEDGLL